MAVDAVREAIDAGYRHIDTAAIYGNEISVGRAIAESSVAREKLFVTSKLWNTERGYDSTLRAFDKSLAVLGLEYLDLYLIHWPANQQQFSNWEELNASTWRAMEELYRQGRIRAIGLSNFKVHHLESLLRHATVLPAVNQIEYHPGFMQQDIVDYCTARNILIEAWSPLGTGRLLDNELLMRIGDKYGKSAAQVCIRWALQNGTLPLPKSVTASRIKENLDVFDFHLTTADMASINDMAYAGDSGLDPDTVDF